MLGSLRFMLALAVAFSHMGLTPQFHFGAMAVAVFYMIAGYVMTHSFTANFDGSARHIGRFYLDRLLRIYPLYAVSLILIVALVFFTGYGKLYLDPYSLFVNAVLLPANVHPTLINPPTWSLASEGQFYLLLPFVLLYKRVQAVLLPLSYLIFVVATFAVIDPVQWGYKYLPGTLWIFLLGSLLYRQMQAGAGVHRHVLTAAGVTVALHLAVLATFRHHIDQPYAFETLCGVLLGLLSIRLLARARPDDRALDNWLGKLSYPLFLSHVCVLYGFDHLRATGVFDPGTRALVALQCMVAIGISVPLALLDDQFQLLRKRFQPHGTAPSPLAHEGADVRIAA